MDLVSRRELSKDASIESVDDWRVSTSASVARDLVHDLVGIVAIRRPTLESARRKSYDIQSNTPRRRNVLLSIIVVMQKRLQLKGTESFKKPCRQSCLFENLCVPHDSLNSTR